MSGPHYSSFDLEEVRKRQLEAERKRRLEEEKRRLEEEKRRLEAKKRQEEMRKKLLIATGNLKEIHKQIADLYIQVEEFKKMIKGNETIGLYINMLIDDMDSIKRHIPDSLTEVEAEIKIQKVKYNEFLNRYDKIVKLNEENQYKENIYVNSITLGNVEEELACANVEFKLEKSYEKYEQILIECQNLNSVSEDDKEVINNLAQRISDLMKIGQGEYELDKTYKILKSKIYNSVNTYEKMSNLYIDYLVRVNTLEFEPKPLKIFKTAQMLETEIKELDHKIAEKDKNEYISKVISEVMSKYGHKILRSDVMMVNSEPYTTDYFDYGNDGVICVTQSKGGAVVMEVAVIGEGTQLSIHEREKNVRLMSGFCSQYPEIKEELIKNGIKIEHKESMPLNECFAKKVDKKLLHTKNKQEGASNGVYKEM